MYMYDNEFKTKETWISTKIKIVSQLQDQGRVVQITIKLIQD